MAVYRFRVTFEDQDDVYRDIEIKSTQTFSDFHFAILQNIAFDTKHAASFFVSDDLWRKNDEITLLKEDVEEGVRLMEKTKIATCIESPHQRFVYLYDKDVCWSFQILLMKILDDDAKQTYPTCVKSAGIAPKQYKVLKPLPDLASPELLLASLLDEKSVDEEAYKFAGGEIEDDEETTEAKKEIFNAEAEEVYSSEDENEFEGSEGEEPEEGHEEGGFSDHGHDDHEH